MPGQIEEGMAGRILQRMDPAFSMGWRVGTTEEEGLYMAFVVHSSLEGGNHRGGGTVHGICRS
jgi:hypothetical protein